MVDLLIAEALRVRGPIQAGGPIVLNSFRETVTTHGIPASTLTDNGMVFTTRLAGGRGGRNALEAELARLAITQKNSTPPTTLTQLQTLLDTFVEEYNHRRPHRSLEHRSTPSTAYQARPKATPQAPGSNAHDRVRHDRIDNAGCVTRVLLLVQELDIRLIDAATGELLRELVLDPTNDYQPTGAPEGPTRSPRK